MTLTHFIKDLLHKHDKLIIPGFGGFVAQYTPAQLNTDKNIILPPGKHFIFDASLTEDDGVFSAFISEKNIIPLTEAVKYVKEMVNDFHKKLKEGNTLFIEEVGYFLLDDNNTIRFKRDDEKNYHTDSFGLKPIEFKLNVQHPGAGELTKIRKSRSTLTQILLIFLAINFIGAIAAILYWKFDNIKAYFQPVTVIKHDPVSDSIKINRKVDTSELGHYIDTTTNIKNALRYEEKPKNEAKPGNTEPSYYIIAGSFQSFKKAETHSLLLKKQGFNPEIIEFSYQLYRVSVGEYKSKEAALSQLELVKCKKGVENAWLLLK